MKSVIFLLLLVLAMSLVIAARNDVEYHVDLLEPRGFRLAWTNAVGISRAWISESIWHEPYDENKYKTRSGPMTRESNGWWVYQNLNAAVNPGDKILFLMEGNAGFETEDILKNSTTILRLYKVPDNATRDLV